MATIDENALLILRIMAEQGISRVKTLELQELVGLNDVEFDPAESYLLQRGLLQGSGGGKSGERSVTPAGIDYVRNEMAHRIPLSIVAEHVLRYMVELETENPNIRNGIRQQDIKERFGLTENELRNALQKLEDLRLIKSAIKNTGIDSGWGVESTPSGRIAVRQDFKTMSVPTSQVQNIFNAPVTATNLVVNAINSSIEQTANDPTAILELIQGTLEELVRQTSKFLDLSQQTLYTHHANELREELEKPQPDRTRIQRLISILSFGDQLNGTLDLGDRAFAAAVVASPYFPVLYGYIEKLLSALGIT